MTHHTTTDGPYSYLNSNHRLNLLAGYESSNWMALPQLSYPNVNCADPQFQFASLPRNKVHRDSENLSEDRIPATSGGKPLIPTQKFIAITSLLNGSLNSYSFS